jgi:NAD(P)-dependent dehydrogenase (short-subunit alcohol dehydrogenase family)
LNGAAYSAPKWGLIGLMKSAALELGRYGITMNAVIPGLIDTSLTRHEDRYAQAINAAGKEPSGHREADEATAADLLATGSPLGVLWIEPADVAPVVAFLASDQARMVSGADHASAEELSDLPDRLALLGLEHVFGPAGCPVARQG